VNERVEEYDGTTAVVRGEHLEAEDIEYLRWRAERWMKLRHLPAALVHSPWFGVRHGMKMLRHTFRGSTLTSLLGLESDRRASSDTNDSAGRADPPLRRPIELTVIPNQCGGDVQASLAKWRLA